MLEEAKNRENTGSKRDCPHGQHLSINEQGPPKNDAVENTIKIESIFVVQNYIMIIYIIFVEQLLLLKLL